MDEDISIINTNTRNEKFKNFFVQYKNRIILVLLFIIFIFISYFGYEEYKNRARIEISNEYNIVLIEYSEENKQETANRLLEIINKKNSTYSPLSLYFIIDNKLIEEQKIVNDLFDLIIEKVPLEKEIKNLIIYKKALFNADDIKENELLNILNPLINSQSVWKSHALYLAAEFFFNKKQMQKSKEFFNQIIAQDNSNLDLKQKAQKRLNRSFSE